MLNPVRTSLRKSSDPSSANRAAEPEFVAFLEEVSGRLLELRAILYAVDVGELLGELPAGPAARRSHQAAASLLAIMDRELLAVVEQLGAAMAPGNVER